MDRFVLLDAGVIGLLCLPPDDPKVVSSRVWLARLIADEVDVMIPDITDYEVRRE